MCGRYTLTVDKRTIEKTLRRPLLHRARRVPANLQRRTVANVAHQPDARPDTIELAKWGFVREDWKKSLIRPQNNARLETADGKPQFHDSFRTQHCLVLANSFYEWKTLPNGQEAALPHHAEIRRAFAMAGIYARKATGYDTAEKNPVTFDILTIKANDAVRHIHKRMPVILPLGHEKTGCHPTPLACSSSCPSHPSS
jgi:putative SOS response-associated peptidase YedK